MRMLLLVLLHMRLPARRLPRRLGGTHRSSRSRRSCRHIKLACTNRLRAQLLLHSRQMLVAHDSSDLLVLRRYVVARRVVLQVTKDGLLARRLFRCDPLRLLLLALLLGLELSFAFGLSFLLRLAACLRFLFSVFRVLQFLLRNLLFLPFLLCLLLCLFRGLLFGLLGCLGLCISKPMLQSQHSALSCEFRLSTYLLAHASRESTACLYKPYISCC